MRTERVKAYLTTDYTDANKNTMSNVVYISVVRAYLPKKYSLLYTCYFYDFFLYYIQSFHEEWEEMMVWVGYFLVPFCTAVDSPCSATPSGRLSLHLKMKWGRWAIEFFFFQCGETLFSPWFIQKKFSVVKVKQTMESKHLFRPQDKFSWSMLIAVMRHIMSVRLFASNITVFYTDYVWIFLSSVS